MLCANTIIQVASQLQTLGLSPMNGNVNRNMIVLPESVPFKPPSLQSSLLLTQTIISCNPIEDKD